ncbi:outer membrane beta-barrel family protein [Winogradskyella immobilis]|uniref:TonB-dependent receptor n=1 Tax=Winogradskyella immobilis TaxID=2816852 RepID=A0ABS8EPI9_9FLAO|nr:outer membrane beta-barrel family protein [Winogradskyella immobilis]MCC1485131.1 TonB-dependent receptor [Winogradskyella immobilis]MCG0017223.1 TonB-dependent receptor family protein [Winogradskyella immobilis]
MKHLLVMFAMLISLAAFPQPNSNSEIKNGSISGRVMDAELNQPLPYVNVVIKDNAGKIITGGITSEDGKFKIEKVPEGTVSVEIQYIGYKTIAKSVTLAKGNYNPNIGDIMLTEDAESLDEVTVVAEVSTIQQKVDRKVINVGKDLTTSGPTASDIMNNIPSVNVDQQTGAIALRGNQNVQVMVDGKLSNIPAAQLLKQIPSTSIKQIELITNPSAKYNPEGMSGIINIILHKNTMVGFNGNFNVGLTREIEPKFNSSLDLNYRSGKFNFYGSYGNNISDNIQTVDLEQIDTGLNQSLNVLDDQNSHLFKVGVDYYINDKNTVSFFTNQNIFDGGAGVNTLLTFDNAPNNNQNQFINNENSNDSQQYNFNYKLDFDDEGHNIELEVDHNIFDSSIFSDNLFSGANTRPNFEENTGIDRNRTTINLDYVNPLSDKAKLELGLQARLFENTINYNSDARVRNEFGDFIPTSTAFDYTRDIFSAYASYGKALDKWSYQLGLRAEFVDVNALAIDTDLINNSATDFPFENDYFQIYPSAFLTYNPSEKNSYQFSFSRRVDRPGVGQVNPIPEFNTALISQFGNPELEPQFTNSVEVNYTRKLKKGSLTGGVFYRLIEDEINQGVFVDRSNLGSGRVILTNDNFDNTSAYGIEISSNYRPTKWWSINASFDLFARQQTGIAETLDQSITNPTIDDISINETEVDNIIYNFRVFNNFRVNKSLSLSAFALYRGPDTGLNFEIDPIYFVNLGLRYNFLQDDRATFSLNFNNVFDTQEISIESRRPFRQNVEVDREFSTIFAGLSYRFGGGKYRAKSRKRRDNDEKSGGGFI